MDLLAMVSQRLLRSCRIIEEPAADTMLTPLDPKISHPPGMFTNKIFAFCQPWKITQMIGLGSVSSEDFQKDSDI
jgi:hypothetical protein